VHWCIDSAAASWRIAAAEPQGFLKSENIGVACDSFYYSCFCSKMLAWTCGSPILFSGSGSMTLKQSHYSKCLRRFRKLATDGAALRALAGEEKITAVQIWILKYLFVLAY